jgi:hypothetical protein
MARLKIRTPGLLEEYGDAVAIHGSAASVWLDGVDISKHVTKVELHCSADQPISAEVTVFVSGLEVDVPLVLRLNYERNIPEPKLVMGGGGSRR